MATSVLLVLLVLLALALLLLAFLWLRERRRVRQLHDEVRQLRDELDTSHRARETFFDLVTHELRSPLSAVLGYHELLEDGAYGALPAEASEPVDRIGRSARHLLHLIDGVVELSRLRGGTLRPDLGPVDLGVVLAAVADAFRTAARERGVVPRVAIPGALPTIRSDQDRLVRALDLLVTSALKHPDDDDRITLDVRTTADGAEIRLAGTAIALREGARDPALRYGIRLAVAQGVARVLGGSLAFDSDEHGFIRAATLRVRSLPE